MSRGRGRGRGRGGGSAGGNPAYAQFTTGDSLNLLQELGLSSSGPKKLYPLFDLPIAFEIEEKDKHFTESYRSLIQSFQVSPSYLKLPPPPKDIDRYSDKYLSGDNKFDPNAGLTHITTDLKYFPSELHSVVDKSKIQRVKSVKFDLLKQIEKAIEKDGKNKEEEEVDKESVEEEEIYDEDDELEGDYADNYFDGGDGDYDDDDGGGADDNYY